MIVKRAQKFRELIWAVHIVTPDPTRETVEAGSEYLLFEVLPENGIDTHQ
jgi:hypothetical protein